MEHYKSDNKLKHFLHIIEDSVVFPVIYDANRTVSSLYQYTMDCGSHSLVQLLPPSTYSAPNQLCTITLCDYCAPN